MGTIASILNAIFGVIFAPFRSLHPAIGLIVLSALTGIVMLLIFGRTSNQRSIRGAKAKLKAHIAEIWLFRDDLLQMLIATARVLGHTARYFAHSLRPLLFIFIPVLIILVMTGARYELRPFRSGERAILAVHLADPAWAEGDQVTLSGSGGVTVSSPALRMPATGEINWEIRADAPGRHAVTLRTPNGTLAKEIAVADGKRAPLTPLAPSRAAALSTRFLEFPVEPPLPAGSGVRWIEVIGWPERKLTIFGLGIHWLVVFFIVSLVAGFAVKDLFGVEV